MTQEEKAKAYDKAIAKSVEFLSLCKKCGAKDTVDFLESIFPELKGSEDEKIRKAILEHIQLCTESIPDRDKFITWLEKQGEKKPAWSEEDEKRLQSCINILKAKSLMGKVDMANTMWLKSLKQRIGG